jgi:hypothetical protein
MENNYFDIPALSKSQLKQYRSDNPTAFWLSSVLNPNYKPITITDQMAFGQLVHLMVLEPARFGEEYIINDGLGLMRRNKKWQEAQFAEQKTIITTEELSRATNMAKALSSFEIIRKLLDGIIAEHTYTWDDKEWLLPCKSRLDAIRNTEKDGLYVIDYKTTGNMDSVERYIDKGGYHFDAGFYSRAIQNKYGKPPSKFFFILQSTGEGEENWIKVKCVEGAMLDGCQVAVHHAGMEVSRRYKLWQNQDASAWLPNIKVEEWVVSPWLDKEIAENIGD